MRRETQLITATHTNDNQQDIHLIVKQERNMVDSFERRKACMCTFVCVCVCVYIYSIIYNIIQYPFLFIYLFLILEIIYFKLL